MREPEIFHTETVNTLQYLSTQANNALSMTLNTNTTSSEVTYPLPRLLLLGPTLRSLAQRDGDERERIFERPPLPWRVSRGATGVKTPDNQSGILKFHRLRQFETKKNPTTLQSGEQPSGLWS